MPPRGRLGLSLSWIAALAIPMAPVAVLLRVLNPDLEDPFPLLHWLALLGWPLGFLGGVAALVAVAGLHWTVSLRPVVRQIQWRALASVLAGFVCLGSTMAAGTAPSS
jgi:hypothetical protein